MGTKRRLAPSVARVVDDLSAKGRVLDLFAGMGSVTASLAPDHPVTANDALAFVSAIARAHMLERRRIGPHTAISKLTPLFRARRKQMLDLFSRRIAREERAMLSRIDLQDWMDSAPHAGTSETYRRHASSASASLRKERYCLATLYFSAGYFSTRQSIEIDAIRYAIERGTNPRFHDQLLSAWIDAMASAINAPGHTAQFLKPSRDVSFNRIRRSWSRSIWRDFIAHLGTDSRYGTPQWRRGNIVHNRDALDLLGDLSKADGIRVVYADPPYTKDQYSRYYHVYETLYLYDFPGSHGAGRYRDDRFVADWSLVRQVGPALTQLAEACARLATPLVLSYPVDGLLAHTGAAISDVAGEWMSVKRVVSPDHIHSTLGASNGEQTKVAQERIYVLMPRSPRRNRRVA